MILAQTRWQQSSQSVLYQLENIVSLLAHIRLPNIGPRILGNRQNLVCFGNLCNFTTILIAWTCMCCCHIFIDYSIRYGLIWENQLWNRHLISCQTNTKYVYSKSDITAINAISIEWPGSMKYGNIRSTIMTNTEPDGQSLNWQAMGCQFCAVIWQWDDEYIVQTGSLWNHMIKSRVWKWFMEYECNTVKSFKCIA